MIGGGDSELVGNPGGIEELDVSVVEGVVDCGADGRVRVGISVSDATADDGD
jgi:hypothetical protein